jgi:hypothetical protein
MIKKTASAFGLILCCLLPVSAQEQGEDEPEDSRRPIAEVRGWIPKADGPVQIVVIAEAGEEPKVLATAAAETASLQEFYQNVPPGRVIFNLQDPDDKVLATATGAIRDGGYYTALAWPESGRWQIKVFSDSSPPNATDKPLRLLHFNAQVVLLLAIDGGPEQDIPLGTVTEKRISSKRTTLHLTVVGTDQRHFASSYFDVDFTAWPSAYVLAQADYRGRIKPMILEGGNTTENQAVQSHADAE